MTSDPYADNPQDGYLIHLAHAFRHLGTIRPFPAHLQTAYRTDVIADAWSLKNITEAIEDLKWARKYLRRIVEAQEVLEP